MSGARNKKAARVLVFVTGVGAEPGAVVAEVERLRLCYFGRCFPVDVVVRGGSRRREFWRTLAHGCGEDWRLLLDSSVRRGVGANVQQGKGASYVQYVF
jgi:hypothetical protein